MKRGHSRAQVAMEYLMIFAFAFFLTIPLIIVYTVQSSQLENDVVNAQLNKLSTEIIDSAEEVYFLGAPSQKTIYVTYPKGIQATYINNTILDFEVAADGRIYNFTMESRVPLNGTLGSFEGLHVITLRATGSGVDVIEN